MPSTTCGSRMSAGSCDPMQCGANHASNPRPSTHASVPCNRPGCEGGSDRDARCAECGEVRAHGHGGSQDPSHTRASGSQSPELRMQRRPCVSHSLSMCVEGMRHTAAGTITVWHLVIVRAMVCLSPVCFADVNVSLHSAPLSCTLPQRTLHPDPATARTFPATHYERCAV